MDFAFSISFAIAVAEMDMPTIRILALGLFPKVVWMADATGIYRKVPQWRYMVAAGNRCKVGMTLSVRGSPPLMCELLDGPHAGIRFDAREACFL